MHQESGVCRQLALQGLLSWSVVIIIRTGRMGNKKEGRSPLPLLTASKRRQI
jgi:hypothetical protein